MGSIQPGEYHGPPDVVRILESLGSKNMNAPNRDYALGRSPHEYARLCLQAELLRPMTRRVFEEAGIGAGMRVLDMGCGAGDVCLLLAEMVGPAGAVIGL